MNTWAAVKAYREGFWISFSTNSCTLALTFTSLVDPRWRNSLEWMGGREGGEGRDKEGREGGKGERGGTKEGGREGRGRGEGQRREGGKGERGGTKEGGREGGEGRDKGGRKERRQKNVVTHTESLLLPSPFYLPLLSLLSSLLPITYS